MSRIDVQTLVLAFEKRIEALEKNPPDKVPTAVIINLLESSIDAIIKDHFIELIKRKLEKNIRSEFKEMHKEFVKKTLNNILSDESYREKLEKSLKEKMISSLTRTIRE